MNAEACPSLDFAGRDAMGKDGLGVGGGLNSTEGPEGGMPCLRPCHGHEKSHCRRLDLRTRLSRSPTISCLCHHHDLNLTS
jgi:hypothetical protein